MTDKDCPLSRAEMKVAKILRDTGESDKVIAKELCLSHYTVKVHMKAIKRKLKIKTRTKLVLLFNQYPEF